MMTAIERLIEHLRKIGYNPSFGATEPAGPHRVTGDVEAFRWVCGELDVLRHDVVVLCRDVEDLRKRNAELERNLAELARGGRR